MQGQPPQSNKQSFGHRRGKSATDEQGEGPSPGPGCVAEVGSNKHQPYRTWHEEVTLLLPEPGASRCHGNKGACKGQEQRET